MTSRLVVLGATVGLVGSAAGAALPNAWVAVPLSMLVGIAVALAGGQLLDDGSQRLLAQLRTWGEKRSDSAVVVTGSRSWRELGTELNRIGEEFDAARRGEADQLLWRDDLVTSLVSGAVLFGPDGHLVASNERGRELLDLPPDIEHATVVQTLASATLVDAVRRAQDQRDPLQVEADVAGRPLRARVSHVGSDTLITLSDRSWERRVEEVRRHFVVNASHELKTPATAIQALAEALEITIQRDMERVPELVSRLQGESDRLVRLVHDLLDLRRLEEDGTVDRVEVDLASVVRRTANEMADRARAREVEIDVIAPDRAPLEVDRDDVELIVRNLIANAVQYNRPGGKVTAVVDRADSGWRLSVTDTGIGIPSQDLPRIFERFYRVDVARSRQSGGTGLGLSLVRHAAERAGGSIEVDSLLGSGSTFTLTLPDRSARADDPR